MTLMLVRALPQFLEADLTFLNHSFQPPWALEALRGSGARGSELTQAEGDPKDQRVSLHQGPGFLLMLPRDLSWVVSFGENCPHFCRLECRLAFPGSLGREVPSPVPSLHSWEVMMLLWPFVSISCRVGIGKGWRLFPACRECGWVLPATPLGPPAAVHPRLSCQK